MRLLICGSRNWTDPEPIRRSLSRLHPGDVLIHGAAPGADTIAGQLAAEMGIAVEAFPADWKRYGFAAGPIRNERMLTEGKPDLIVAFPLDGSRGTLDMMHRGVTRGIPTFDGTKGGA